MWLLWLVWLVWLPSFLVIFHPTLTVGGGQKCGRELGAEKDLSLGDLSGNFKVAPSVGMDRKQTPPVIVEISLLSQTERDYLRIRNCNHDVYSIPTNHS